MKEIVDRIMRERTAFRNVIEVSHAVCQQLHEERDMDEKTQASAVLRSRITDDMRVAAHKIIKDHIRGMARGEVLIDDVVEVLLMDLERMRLQRGKTS